MKTFKPLLSTIVLPGMLLLGACTCSNEVLVKSPPPPPAPVQKPKPVPPPPPPAPAPVVSIGDILFDFNKSDIRKDATVNMDKVIVWMNGHPDKNIVIEAHSDAIGTREYNLKLGFRRANAAMDYLVKKGITPERLKTVSYGKERPFAVGDSESARAQNRRVHFVLE